MSKNQFRLETHIDYINFDSLAQLTHLNLRNLLYIFDAIIGAFVEPEFNDLHELIDQVEYSQSSSNVNTTNRNKSYYLTVISICLIVFIALIVCEFSYNNREQFTQARNRMRGRSMTTVVTNV